MEFSSNLTLFQLLSFIHVLLVIICDLSFHILLILLLAGFIITFILKPYFVNQPEVYLVNFSCLKPPNYCRIPSSTFLENASMIGCFDKETLALMSKVLSISGQSDETYLPPSLFFIPPKSHHQDSINEVHMVLFPVMKNLLIKTNLSALDIDILIVNCSGFCPSPSLSSIIINEFSMRNDVKSYNLSGMGCSASMAAIDLAKNLFHVHKNSNAVVLSTEILSTGWYPGNEASMIVLNCFFRMGSSAVLLTNKKEAKSLSKYMLLRTLRTVAAHDDNSYTAAMREEDSSGKTGFRIRKGLLQAINECIRTHITLLGSEILPVSEKLRYGLSVLRKKYADKSKEIYVPSFRSVIQHFVLPTSGKPYVREIGKGLKLNEKETEGALMTLHRFGNQSSCSLWYELAYLEAKERIKKGDKVWQFGLGSGTKCNSAIWKCLRPIVGEARTGPWADCINRYPIGSVDL